MKLREVYKDHGRFKSQAKKLQKWILKNFKEDEQYEKFNNVIKDYIFDDWNIDDWYNELNDSAQ
jgi:hypothetical protein